MRTAIPYYVLHTLSHTHTVSMARRQNKEVQIWLDSFWWDSYLGGGRVGVEGDNLPKYDMIICYIDNYKSDMTFGY